MRGNVNLLRLVQVCTGYPPDRRGGIENIVKLLHETALQNSYESFVVTRYWNTTIDTRNIIQIRTPSNEIAGYATWAIRAFKRIINLKPNLVHCHGLEGAMVGLMTSHVGIPTIMHLHNSLSREDAFFESLLHRMGYTILKSACKGASLIIVPTKAVKDDIVKHTSEEIDKKIMVIPNPVEVSPSWSETDLSNFKKQHGFEGKKIVLYFGKIKRTKGIESLCRAYEKLNDESVLLIIAGAPTATSNFLDYLRKQYPKVIFTGYVEDATPYYQSADAFCIYTRGFEGGETFAISLGEAMFYRVPLICSDSPIYREVTGGFATFVPPNNEAELAKAIKYVLKTEHRDSESTLLAYRLAYERYRPAIFWQKVVESYFHVLKNYFRDI